MVFFGVLVAAASLGSSFPGKAPWRDAANVFVDGEPVPGLPFPEYARIIASITSSLFAVFFLPFLFIIGDKHSCILLGIIANMRGVMHYACMVGDVLVHVLGCRFAYGFQIPVVVNTGTSLLAFAQASVI